jgi:hypothetical protein
VDPHRTGTGVGPYGIAPYAGQNPAETSFRVLPAGSSAVVVEGSVTAFGAAAASAGATAWVAGRLVRPFVQAAPTAVAAGDKRLFDEAVLELGGLPVERVVVRVDVLASQSVAVVPYEFDGQVAAEVQAQVSVGPLVEAGPVNPVASVSISAAGYDYVPGLKPTLTAAGSGSTYPRFGDEAIIEIGGLPLTRTRFAVSIAATTTVAAESVAQAITHQLAEASVVVREIQFGAVLVEATASVVVAPVEFGASSQEGFATVEVDGEPIMVGEVSVEATATTSIDSLATRFAVFSQSGVAHVAWGGIVTFTGQVATLGAAAVSVGGLLIPPGDGSQAGSGRLLVIIRTDPRPMVHIPGTAVENLPVPDMLNSYKPEERRVVVVSSG